MASITKQAEPEKKSKKQFSKNVFARLTGSLADFNLKEKKLQNRLKKVSKQLAADILRNNKAEAKVKAQENPTEEKVVHIKQKKTKDKKVAAAE